MGIPPSGPVGILTLLRLDSNDAMGVNFYLPPCEVESNPSAVIKLRLGDEGSNRIQVVSLQRNSGTRCVQDNHFSLSVWKIFTRY